MQQTRRSVIKAGGAAALVAAFGATLLMPGRAQAAWNKGAFEAKSIFDAMRALGMANAEDTKAVEIRAPDIAENGAVVPIAIESRLPGTESITLLIERNPQPLAASFSIPAGTEPNVSTRVKIGESSDVYALVKAEGKFYLAKKEVKITIGGCGG